MWDISGNLYLIHRCLNLFSRWVSVGLTPAFSTHAICSRIFHSCIFFRPSVVLTSNVQLIEREKQQKSHHTRTNRQRNKITTTYSCERVYSFLWYSELNRSPFILGKYFLSTRSACDLQAGVRRQQAVSLASWYSYATRSNTIIFTFIYRRFPVYNRKR